MTTEMDPLQGKIPKTQYDELISKGFEDSVLNVVLQLPLLSRFCRGCVNPSDCLVSIECNNPYVYKQYKFCPVCGQAGITIEQKIDLADYINNFRI